VSGTLAQLRPAADAADQTTRYNYDARGNQVGELDAEGYFTERTFDEVGNTRAERRYLAQLSWQAGDTLSSLRSRAGSLYRESRMADHADQSRRYCYPLQLRRGRALGAHGNGR
jgi:YD repeat-containing protein